MVNLSLLITIIQAYCLLLSLLLSFYNFTVAILLISIIVILSYLFSYIFNVKIKTIWKESLQI
jgi:hypothetical protein